MDLGEAKKAYVFTTRIEIKDEGEFIELREPTVLEMKEFGEDSKKNYELLIKILPACIVGHSFTSTVDGEKLPSKNKDVAAFLMESGSLFTKIINTWMESLPLEKKVK